jgi:hypothetical protein
VQHGRSGFGEKAGKLDGRNACLGRSVANPVKEIFCFRFVFLVMRESFATFGRKREKDKNKPSLNIISSWLHSLQRHLRSKIKTTIKKNGNKQNTPEVCGGVATSRGIVVLERVPIAVFIHSHAVVKTGVVLIRLFGLRHTQQNNQ